jgi:glutamyl-tRNA(Gln) amidotransferase subunit D
VIIEGTGLGHAPISVIDDHTKSHKKIHSALTKLIKGGTQVAMASQTIDGRINLNVYSTGRNLKKMGMLGNLTTMTPETAFIKLAWLLSNYDTKMVSELYSEDLRGENVTREEYDTY